LNTENGTLSLVSHGFLTIESGALTADTQIIDQAAHNSSNLDAGFRRLRDNIHRLVTDAVGARATLLVGRKYEGSFYYVQRDGDPVRAVGTQPLSPNPWLRDG
jgi:hypothetical protein